jgi:membrane carboxypeptidase/penicillin-binding protein PbpC
LIPMCEVVTKLKINIPYLQKMANVEDKWFLSHVGLCPSEIGHEMTFRGC